MPTDATSFSDNNFAAQVTDDEYQEAWLSRRAGLIGRLVGKRVTRLLKVIFVTPEDEAAQGGHPLCELFRQGCGPLLLEVEGGLLVGFGYQESWQTVTVWMERRHEGDLSRPHRSEETQGAIAIPADHHLYSEPRYVGLVGQRIEAAQILFEGAHRDWTGMPFREHLRLELEGGREFFVAWSSEFSLDGGFTRDQLPPAFLACLTPVTEPVLVP